MLLQFFCIFSFQAIISGYKDGLQLQYSAAGAAGAVSGTGRRHHLMLYISMVIA
jgi:hypothetical protein